MRAQPRRAGPRGCLMPFDQQPERGSIARAGPPDQVTVADVHFRAADRTAADAVHRAAVAAGAEVLHAPREWPEYLPGYYAVYLRDLDGHNVEDVYHGNQG
jgi:hypothetical protein